jgi:hypothetical protein
VLLVKRFKRLPPGSNRHWGHVVDARTGPGLKSMTKFKKRKEEQEAGDKVTSMSERLGKFFKKKKKDKAYKKETSSLGGSSADESPPSPTESQNSDDFDESIFDKKFFNYSTRSNQKKRQKIEKQQRHRRKNPKPMKIRWPQNHVNFFMDVVDNNEQWSRRMTCCGVIYENVELKALFVDETMFKPCLEHQKKNQQVDKKETLHQQQQPTAIKKHQMFLKRHEQPSNVITNDNVIISLVETSNKHKTEPMETILPNEGNDESLKPFDKLRRLNENKAGKFRISSYNEKLSITHFSNGISENITDENDYGKKDISSSDKFLHKLNSESTKISKQPSTIFNTPLSASLKFKLANIVKCGTLGDNSSDSGYEEVQDGSKIPTIQSDVMQSL